MPKCPQGHDSSDDEFCEVCGRAMDGPAPSAVPAAAPAPDRVAAGVATAPELPPEGAECQACGAVLAGRFCEACGHDSLAELPDVAEPEPVAVASSWTATVTADRAYYDSIMAIDGPDAAAIKFPPFCPDRHFPLQGKQISIGRQSRTRGIHPDIDLIGPPEDPGVSHLHAMLVSQPNGSWSIVDLDSANGTTLNDNQNPLPPNTPHPLSNADRIYLGAWTRITLSREG